LCRQGRSPSEVIQHFNEFEKDFLNETIEDAEHGNLIQEQEAKYEIEKSRRQLITSKWFSICQSVM